MTFTREEAARRAEVDVVLVDRLVELGIIAPDDGGRFTQGTIRKIGLMATLQAGGLPDEALASKLHAGRLSLEFLDSPSFDHFSAMSELTFEDLSRRTGIALELLLAIREAIGSAVASPSDHVREIELAIVPLIEAELETGYQAGTVERLLRTMREGLRRFVLAESAAFRENVIEPVARRPGVRGIEISAAAVSATERPSGAVDQAMLAVYHAQQAHAWTANILEGFERDLAGAGLYGLVERPPAMCFFDITGYTRLTSERGDEAAAELADQVGRLVQRASVRHGGRAVKWLGDGVMFHFPDPGRGVLAALEMRDGVRDAGLPPAHVGLHAGPVLFQDGDYYGMTVNVASRIVEYARPSEVLVSQAVVDAAAEAPCDIRRGRTRRAQRRGRCGGSPRRSSRHGLKSVVGGSRDDRRRGGGRPPSSELAARTAATTRTSRSVARSP